LLRPHEASAFEPLLEQTQSIAVEPEQLHHVTAPPAKDEDVARVGLLLKRSLHLGRKTLKAAPHIRHARRNPDPRACTLLLQEKVDHARKPSSTARIVAGAAWLSTLIRTSPGSSMCIEPQLGATTSSGGRSTTSRSDMLTGKSFIA